MSAIYSGDLNLIFSKIDEKPLASASIGQVHRAWLLDGTAVVVKVQHADVESLLMHDMANLKQLSWGELGSLCKMLWPSEELNVAFSFFFFLLCVAAALHEILNILCWQWATSTVGYSHCRSALTPQTCELSIGCSLRDARARNELGTNSGRVAEGCQQRT